MADPGWGHMGARAPTLAKKRVYIKMVPGNHNFTFKKWAPTPGTKKKGELRYMHTTI